MSDEAARMSPAIAASLVARESGAVARFLVGAGEGQDPLPAAARIAGVLAGFRPGVRLLSNLSIDVAVVTLPDHGFGPDVGAAFELAGLLADASGAAEVEPDLPYAVTVEPDALPSGAVREGVLGVPGCWAGRDPTLDGKERWAPEMLNASQAWAFSKAAGRPVAGAGVVVAHLDTGLVAHREFEGAKILPGVDLIDDDTTPTDPLGYAGEPGHGTSTASVIVSPAAGRILGTAPAASLLPIRCISTVIVVFASAIAEAIDVAVEKGGHVITMSLGGLSSFSLERALARAVAADVIVLAAAGNCVRFVVYPAADPNCLAIGGVNARSVPWQGSCRGSEVDVCAPAENVFRAVADNADTTKLSQGEGTSFAVALTAGAAACWIAHHGRARAIAEARRRGITLQQLFRLAVTGTARRPGDWDPMRFGAGIVNMDALLRLRLEDIADREGGSGRMAMPTNTGRVKNVLLAMSDAPDDALVASRVHAVRTEIMAHIMLGQGTGASGTASPALSQAIGARGLAALGLPAADGAGVAAPRILARMDDPASPREASLRRVRRRFAAKGTGFEGMRRESIPDDAPLPALDAILANVDPDNIDAFLSRFPPDEAPDPEELKRALRITSAALRRGYRKLENTRGIVNITGGERAALEAVVNIDGSSPSLLVRNNKVMIDHPLAGSWKERLSLANDNLLGKVCPAIGRIQPLQGGPGDFFGTGTHVARLKASDPPLVLTNFHVLDKILRTPGVQSRQSGNRIAIFGGPGIDFQGEIERPVSVTHRIVAARLPAGVGQTDTTLDAVALEIRAIDPAAGGEPAPVVLSAELSLALDAAGDLLVIGFPGQPARMTGIDSDTGIDWGWVTSVLFANRFGLKRVAPGEVEQRLGALGPGRHASIFTHDATTLGGSSGSLVFGFGTGTVGLGLHFAGLDRTRNEAHALGPVADALRGIGIDVLDPPG